MKFILTNKTNLILNLILGLSLFFIKCKRDVEIIPVNSPTNDCIDIPAFQGTGFGYNYITNGKPIYYAPVLNPNNNNELLILKQDSAFIYNRISKLTIFSFKFPFLAKVSWSIKKWMLIGGSDQKIYKIKPNGDSLTLLVNTTNNSFPIWNDDGNLFSAVNNSINKTIIYTDLGIPIDTIEFTNLPFSSWGGNNKIISGRNKLFVYDVNTHSTNYFYDLGTSGSVTGCFWLNNNEIIWSHIYGILKTNILTNQTTLLKSTCNSNIYSYPSYDKILNKIIWRKQIQTYVDTYNVKAENKIIITDVDCNNEEEIIIN